MTNDWLPEDDWAWIQRRVPIACVDVLALRFDLASLQPQSVGLILRDVPDAGRRWCLMGGRIRYGEAILDALARHVHDTLGERVRFATTSGDQPIYVAQYAPDARPGFGLDPRRHAIALTFAITLEGEVKPQGEAFEFRWFAADSPPTASAFGFGQDAVVSACLKAVGNPARGEIRA